MNFRGADNADANPFRQTFVARLSPTGRNSPDSRTYRKPTLTRGPVLTSVTSAKAISGALPICWVARAAFGDTDVRWLLFREWLAVDAPVWFRNLYVQRGEAVGAWLRRHGVMRLIVRALMAPAVNRTLRK